MICCPSGKMCTHHTSRLMCAGRSFTPSQPRQSSFLATLFKPSLTPCLRVTQARPMLDRYQAVNLEVTCPVVLCSIRCVCVCVCGWVGVTSLPLLHVTATSWFLQQTVALFSICFIILPLTTLPLVPAPSAFSLSCLHCSRSCSLFLCVCVLSMRFTSSLSVFF